MALLRAVAVLKHRSGLPRDNVANNFHFTTADETAATAEVVAEKVRDFYTIMAAGANKAIMEHIGYQIQETGHEVRVYPIDVTTNTDTRGISQPPLHIEVFDFVGRSSTAATGDNLPSEVAVCLSYKNTASGNIPPAQRRGRVFFGPLGKGSFETADEAVTDIPRPPAQFRTNLLQAGIALSNNVAGGQWVIYHRPRKERPETPRPGRTTLPFLAALPGAVHAITDLWVDNAFDTQRRRGERATSRVTAVT
jgi:hypothetical protein